MLDRRVIIQVPYALWTATRRVSTKSCGPGGAGFSNTHWIARAASCPPCLRVSRATANRKREGLDLPKKVADFRR